MELFGRFDYSTSSTASGEINPWNYILDGKFIIAGIQRTITSNVKLALDYQGHYPYTGEHQDLVFVNALFSF